MQRERCITLVVNTKPNVALGDLLRSRIRAAVPIERDFESVAGSLFTTVAGCGDDAENDEESSNQ